MNENVIIALLGVAGTCFFLVASMTAALLQTTLEKKRYKFLNSLAIIASVVLLFLSMGLLIPAQDDINNINDITRIEVPSTLFVDTQAPTR